MNTHGVEPADLDVEPPDPTGAAQDARLAHDDAELSTMVEELAVTQEELRQQNLELLTTRDLAEQAHRRYLDLFAFAPDAYLVTDLYGRIQEANRAAAALFGLESRFLVGKPLAVFVPPDERRRFRTALSGLRNAVGTEQLELRLHPRHGAPFDALLTVAVVHRHENLKAGGLRWLVRDITQRKRMEAELRALTTELEQRVAERTSQLQAATQELDELLAREQAARQAAEQAADRVARLQAVTAALAGALTPEQVAGIILEQGLAALGAAAGSVALLADDRSLEIAHSVGYPPDMVAAWRCVSLDAPVPLAESVRSGEPVWLADLEAYATHYPHLATTTQFTGSQAFACLPLRIEGRILGGLGLSFPTPQRFSPEDRAFGLALAGQCAQALERARLYAAEQTARTAAEASQRRLAFLAEASAVLAGSLDYAATLDSVAHLAVPTLGDFCIVDVVAGDDLNQIAAAHVDPAQAARLREVRRRYQPGTGWEQHPVVDVLRTGRSAFFPAVEDSGLARVARDAEHLQALRDLGITSYMVVPLVARGQTLGTIALARTASGRRCEPDDLALAEELARRAALAIDNARLFDDIQAALRVRDTFLSAITHDLKTPLTAIKGIGQLAARRLDSTRGLDPAWLAEALGRIDDSTDHMTALVDELLHIAHVQAGYAPSLNLSATDLVALARSVVDRHAALAPSHELCVEGPASLVGTWDAGRLQRVLDNLVDNAVKYSPHGGRVVVRIARQRAAGAAWAVLTVSDQGVGIPAADLPHIFDHFHRASNVTSDFAGTGIGLATVRQIVEQHGGSIAAASQEGAGTTFTVRLPLTKRET